ncbi:MAG: DUF1441 family protein [Rhizobiaceae bacterium]|nr:DUF1441 family protein [Rhizobiaceae bacterium]
MDDLLETIVPEAGVWMKVAELAKARGITRQSMSERVKKLEKGGHITTRKEGRFVLVNVPEFDVAVSAHGNGYAEQSANTKSNLDTNSSPELRKSQALKAGYDAEMARIKLEREQGKLLEIKEVERAATKIGLVIIRELEKLPSFARDIHNSAADESYSTIRSILRKVAHDCREAMAKELQKVSEDILKSNEEGK